MKMVLSQTKQEKVKRNKNEALSKKNFFKES